jgi:dTDP-4-amino-4,6-dideoxygalactose transaminase
MLDLERQHAPLREEIFEAIARVCGSNQFILGKEVEALERELGTFLGTEVAACSSGTDALWLALVAAGVQPGDSVITTPFSFFASASAIVRARAKPVFADINPGTLNLDPADVALRARSAPSLRALLPVHLYGQCAEMDSLKRIAAEAKIAIVEDAAQAIGASWRGARAGSLGTTAAFSFYPTKNLSAFGDAGCATGPKHLAERMRSLRNHGSVRRYYHEEIGWNCRMDAIQAAVLRIKLKHAESWNDARRQLAATYDKLFKNSGLLGKSGRVQLPETRREAHHVFHQYVIRASRRDQLREFLSKRNIGSEIYYPLPLHLQNCFAYLGYREGDFPEAEAAAREVLALPMFAELTESEQRAVVEAVADFYS